MTTRRRGEAVSSYKPSTRRQDDVLRRLYPMTPIAVLLRMPTFRGRSKDSMKCRGKTLGVATKMRRPLRWSDAELAILHVEYHLRGSKGAGRLLPTRTIQAIRDKASKIGLSFYRHRRRNRQYPK
jgi:hypothetical protein